MRLVELDNFVGSLDRNESFEDRGVVRRLPSEGLQRELPSSEQLRNVLGLSSVTILLVISL
jgi:hypothetical protein